LQQLAFVHSLTLVRYLLISSALGTIGPLFDRAGDIATTQSLPTRQIAARQFVIGGRLAAPRKRLRDGGKGR
jgi:hypothetical protein